MRSSTVLNYILFLIVMGLLVLIIFGKSPDSQLIDAYRRQNDSLAVLIAKKDSAISVKLDSVKALEKTKIDTKYKFIYDTTYIEKMQNTDSIYSAIRNQLHQLKGARYDLQ